MNELEKINILILLWLGGNQKMGGYVWWKVKKIRGYVSIQNFKELYYVTNRMDNA